MLQRIFSFLRQHTYSSIGALIVVLVLYFILKTGSNGSGATLYMVAAAEKGLLNVSVSGTGQVAAITQVDVKPKVSGTVLKIPVKEGQQVSSGAVLVQLDTKDLQTQLDQALLSLQQAQASLNLKLAGPTPENVIMSENAVKTAQMAYDTSVMNLNKAKQDAAQALQTSQLSLDKANAALTDAQTQYDHAVATVATTNDSTSQNVQNDYNNAKTSVNASILSMSNALPLADSVLGIDKTDLNSSFKVYLGALNSQSLVDANNAYPLAKYALNSLETQYNAVQATWTQDQADQILIQTVQALQQMKTLIHDTYVLLLNTMTGGNFTQSQLDSYKSSMSSQESSLLSQINQMQGVQQSIASDKLNTLSTGIKNSSSIDSAQSTLDNAKRDQQIAQTNLAQTQRDNATNIYNAQQDIISKQIALQNAQASYNLLVAPPRAVDVASAKLQVKQAEESYQTAKQNMLDATVTAPIDGIVAKINVNIGDIVANGQATNGTAMVTMITQSKYAQLSLNEVDAAKVAVGQKANISFDALDGLNITGNVIAVDLLGTVSQGVVSYNVKVGFDTQDERIKPGMSANVSIITLTKMDAILVPNGAVKTQNGTSYVQIADGVNASNMDMATTQGIALNPAPRNQTVEVGVSNDTMTEIISGVKEGDYVVVRTVSSSQKTTAASSSSGGIRIPGITGGGGGFRPGG
jgi:HlyD family secretion protein